MATTTTGVPLQRSTPTQASSPAHRWALRTSAGGLSAAGARAVGETDATAWAAVLDALDRSDGAALNNAIAAIVTDTAFRVLGVAGIRGDLEMILRGYARSHELARDTCLHDHHHEVGGPCPRSAT